MKKIFVYGFLLLLHPELIGQDLIIKGRVRCMNQSTHSTKGAENIIIVPTFVPSKSALTVSSPSGYFEFNTGIKLQVLQDKQVNIYVISSCSGCRDIVKTVFISEDQDRQNKDDSKSYVTIKNWMLDKNCQEIELSPTQADSLLAVIQRQPEQKLAELTNATAVVGTPALLNLLTTLTTVLVPVPPATGIFVAEELLEGKINYGRFLFASAMTHTASPGFSFAPSRELSEAVFWNPSAMPYSKNPYSISLLTNVKNNGKLALFAKLSDKFSLGAGAIYTMQDEFRNGNFRRNEDPFDLKLIDSINMELKEYTAYVSSAYKVNDQLSFGLSVKSIWQQFNNPVQIEIGFDQDTGEDTNDFTFTDVEEQSFDVDFSVSYKVSKSFQVGLNAMNLAGTELYSDAFVPGETNLPIQNQRSLGLGFNYKYARFNFGTDLLFTEDDFYDATIGINYVPFNEALISAGMAVKQKSFSVGFRMKHFRLAYIDDNDFLANEKRKGKSGILDGKLYGGFSFSF